MSKDNDVNIVAWEASEYIHHEKSLMGYVMFAVATIGILGGTYVLIHDIIAIVIVTMMAIVVVIFANRPPHSLKYELGDDGLKVEEREYPYSAFKSFSVMEYGAVESVYLEPVERFMPPISVYFSPEDGDRIISLLGTYLPHRERKPDIVDQLVHRIRL